MGPFGASPILNPKRRTLTPSARSGCGGGCLGGLLRGRWKVWSFSGSEVRQLWEHGTWVRVRCGNQGLRHPLHPHSPTFTPMSSVLTQGIPASRLVRCNGPPTPNMDSSAGAVSWGASVPAVDGGEHLEWLLQAPGVAERTEHRLHGETQV